MACHRVERARLAEKRAGFVAALKAAAPVKVARTAAEKRAAQKAWRAAHPGYLREWRQQHPEQRRSARKARRLGRRERLVADLREAQGARCAYCRTKLGDDCHVDHIVPLSKGGPNRRSNLQLTCPPCNLSKSAQDPIAFAQSLGRLL